MVSPFLFIVTWTVFWVSITVGFGFVIRVVKKQMVTTALLEAMLGFVTVWVIVSAVEIIALCSAMFDNDIPVPIAYLIIAILPTTVILVARFAFKRDN